MHALAKRLRRRMDFLGLGVDETAARAGVKYKAFSRYITGTAKQNLHPDVFVRLCAVLAITPDQAFGQAPMAGVDADVPTDAATRERERIRASLGVLDEAGLWLAADLLETVVRSQAR
ncbi:helix-turn-helix transcriptional regulator [Azospirillum sp.]|uniref:helix-turn-helix domain-containing protein n=1 Tax=Azospirillum sp. TaxID=34012 RepID=UPI002D594626|nr:helix-turn-helix transcriptional regulator [Azospirillum sp.]HYD70731.1 helix-turn-helix transcriptional regulator [Azospirillum sp.]